MDPEIGRRIVYWLDTGTEHRPSDSEALSKNTPLDSVDELLLIPGIDEKTYDKLLPYVTIYGNKVIDINTAGVPALMAADSRMTKDVAERIVQYRQLTPFSSSADLEKVLGFSDTGISSGKFMVTGGAFRVLVTAESAGIKRTVECVLEGSAANWKVTYWKET
jgi:general secretion pathway protein K